MHILASQVYGSSDDDARNLRDFSSNRGLLRGGSLARTGKQLLPPNQGEFNDCQVCPFFFFWLSCAAEKK